MSIPHDRTDVRHFVALLVRFGQKAAITAADIANPGMVLVFVFNPPENNTTRVSGAIGVNTVTVCSGKDSNAIPFTINP